MKRRALEITSVVGCALDCKMCPQTKIKAAYKGEKRVMDIEDIRTMLQKVPRDVEIHGSGFSEIFLNPHGAAMLKVASDAGFQVMLYSTLVGLNQAQAEILRGVRLAGVRIHVPDKTEMPIKTAPWLRQLDLFLSTAHTGSYMAMGPIEDDLAAAMQDRGIPVALPTMLSRAGNLGWVAPARPISGRLTCNAARYWMHVLLPDGTVVGCSMLYDMEIVLGNLMTDSYEKIEEAADRWAADEDPPENSPCRKCEWATPI